jgi:hypothetical protein
MMQAHNKNGQRAGCHMVMKATISGVDLFLLAYVINNRNRDRQGILGLEGCWSTKNP